MWLSPFADNLKLSQYCLLMGHTPIQSKQLKNLKKKKKRPGPQVTDKESAGLGHLASQRQATEQPSSQRPGLGSSLLSQLFDEAVEMTAGLVKCLQHV